MLNAERKKSKSCPKLSASACGETSSKIVVKDGSEDVLLKPQTSSPVTDIRLNTSPPDCDLCKVPNHQSGEKISINLADVEDYCTLTVLKEIPRNVNGQKASLILKEIKSNNIESCTTLPSINLKYVNVLKAIDVETYKFDRMSTRNESKLPLNAINFQMMPNENKKRIQNLIKPQDSEMTHSSQFSYKKQCDVKCKFPNTENSTKEISINVLKAIPDSQINDKNERNKPLKNDSSPTLGSNENPIFLNIPRDDCALSSASCSMSPKNKRFDRADAFLSLLTNNDKNASVAELDDEILGKFDLDDSQSTDNDLQTINLQGRKNNSNDKVETSDKSPQSTSQFYSFPQTDTILKSSVDKNEELLEYANSKWSSIKFLETGNVKELDQSTIKLFETCMNPSLLNNKSIVEDNTFTDKWVPFDWSDHSRYDTSDSISFIDDLYSQDSSSEVVNPQKHPISSSIEDTKIDKNQINKLLFKVYSKYKKKPINTVCEDVIKSFKGSLKYCIESDVKSPSIYLSLVLQMILLENTTLFLKKFPFCEFFNDFLEHNSHTSNKISTLTPTEQELTHVVQNDCTNYYQMFIDMNCYAMVHPNELQFYSKSIPKHIFTLPIRLNCIYGFYEFSDYVADAMFNIHLSKYSNTSEINEQQNVFVPSAEINIDLNDYYEETTEFQYIVYDLKHEQSKQAIFTTEITNYNFLVVKLLKSLKIKHIKNLKRIPRFHKMIKPKSHQILKHEQIHSQVANLHSRIIPAIIVSEGDVKTKIDPSFDSILKSSRPMKRAKSFKINREPLLGDRIVKEKSKKTQTVSKRWDKGIKFSENPNKRNEYSHIHFCEICGESFQMKMTLRYHLRNHSTQLSSKCN